MDHSDLQASAPMSVPAGRSTRPDGRGVENAPVRGRHERIQTRPSGATSGALRTLSGVFAGIASRTRGDAPDRRRPHATTSTPGSAYTPPGAAGAAHPVFGDPRSHLSIAGPPAEDRYWRRFVRHVECGVDVDEAIAAIGAEHGAQARRIVHWRLRALVLAAGRDMEVGG